LPIPHEDQRTAAGGGRDADARRNTEAHAGIISGRRQRGVFDLHRGEQAIADVGRHRHHAVAVEQIVHRRRDVGRHDRLAVRRHAAPIADRLYPPLRRAVRPGPLDQGLDQLIERHVRIDVMADPHRAVGRQNAVARRDQLM
jgi:hypothetical protein